MSAMGSVGLDFGAWPGNLLTSVDIIGQVAIQAYPTSLVECWIIPLATVDHTADEHPLESFEVFAGNIIAGTGFTIYGVSEWIAGGQAKEYGGNSRFAPWGLWTIGWCWNT